jgi:hypothetical protein
VQPIVYNLYPAIAAFNVANVSGLSKNVTGGFNLKTIWGGANISVQQQKDRLTQSMQQSVYVSGYRGEEQNATTFGWYYGPPAFMKVVRPGTYTTYAILLLPRGIKSQSNEEPRESADALTAYENSTQNIEVDGACSVQIEGRSFWVRKGRVKELTPEKPLISNPDRFLPSDGPPMIAQVQYTPQPLPPVPTVVAGAAGAITSAPSPVATGAVGAAPSTPSPVPAPIVNLIGIEFERPINPNLMIYRQWDAPEESPRFPWTRHQQQRHNRGNGLSGKYQQRLASAGALRDGCQRAQLLDDGQSNQIIAQDFVHDRRCAAVP